MGDVQNNKKEGITLVSLEELIKSRNDFFIPDYQRGYRWEESQVNDLLDDLLEFYVSVKNNKKSKEIYCVQPLVVIKKQGEEQYRVIDGQQRLTTFHILLSCLGVANKYSITYQTRKESKDFLKKILEKEESEASKKSDYYFMFHAKVTMQKWLENPPEYWTEKLKDTKFEKKDFLKIIRNRVNFIWYPIDSGQDEIKVFKDLNIGKISLTESELIKAMFLNSNNFNDVSDRDEMLTMVEMAGEWDQMEYHLHDDRFWLFFHDTGYTKPTRIDFILELCMKLKVQGEKIDAKAKDAYPVFSYFYKEFNKAKDRYKYVLDTWNEITKYYNIINEWYNNDEYYHYIGFLSATKKEKSEDIVTELIKEYGQNGKDKIGFKNHLVVKIKEALPKTFRDLDYVYEEENGKTKKSKTNARPFLLLHNIQTVLYQNEKIKNEGKYNLPDFLRFPFHLYKKENWDIEHIRPNNKQMLNRERDKNDRARYVCIQEMYWKNHDLNNLVDEYRKAFMGDDKEKEMSAFYAVVEKVDELDVSNTSDELENDEKNQIWNYVLLDASTNREYGNSCYAIKRDFVFKKKNGKKPKVEVDKNGELITDNNNEIPLEDEAAFVPICTEMVFSKAYTQYPDNLKSWDKKDALAYKADLKKKLGNFF